MISYIKNLLSNYLVLIKIGNFYEAYNDDAKILSYLFNYKLKTIDHIYSISGFPLVAIHKVKSLLEKKEISYILIDKSILNRMLLYYGKRKNLTLLICFFILSNEPY